MVLHDENILDSYNPENILRKVFLEYGQVSLRDHSDIFDYSGFRREFYTFPNSENPLSFQKKRRDVLLEFIEGIPVELHGKNRFCASLDELIRNAQKHGNKHQEDKNVGLAWRMSEVGNKGILEVIVEDEGGELDSQFIPYIMELKKSIVNGASLDGYYDYLSQTPPEGHSGSGLKAVSFYFDDIDFYKSDLGGLAVKTVKEM